MANAKRQTKKKIPAQGRKLSARDARAAAKKQFAEALAKLAN